MKLLIRNSLACLLFSSLLFTGESARAQVITPIAATGWNANVVYDFGSGTYQGSSDNVNAPVVGVDNNYAPAAANSGYTNSLPSNLVVTTSDGSSYQLGPLSAQSGLRVDHSFAAPTPTLTLTTPAAYSEIGFLATGGDGGGTVNYTLNFASGAPETGSFNVPDWVGGGATGNYSAQYVLAGQLPNGGNTGYLIRLYDFTAPITSTANLTSISFTYSGSHEIALFGVSGTPISVPEPAIYALLFAGILMLGTLHFRRRLS